MARPCGGFFQSLDFSCLGMERYGASALSPPAPITKICLRIWRPISNGSAIALSEDRTAALREQPKAPRAAPGFCFQGKPVPRKEQARPDAPPQGSGTFGLYLLLPVQGYAARTHGFCRRNAAPPHPYSPGANVLGASAQPKWPPMAHAISHGGKAGRYPFPASPGRAPSLHTAFYPLQPASAPLCLRLRVLTWGPHGQ